MVTRGDTSSGVMRGEKVFKFKGVSEKGVVVEVKNASKEKCCYFTFPSGTSQALLAIFRDLFVLSNDPHVDDKNLNLNMVVEFLGSSLIIDKSFYQDFIMKNPFQSLTKKKTKKKELCVMAQEVYNLLVIKVSGIEGRTRENEANILPAFEEGVKYQENLRSESLQQEESKKKDAECKEKDVEVGRLKESVSNLASECKEKDAEIGRWKKACEEKDAEIGRLNDAANAKVDGQPLKRRASSVTATGELQRGNASTSKDATPASLLCSLCNSTMAEIDELMNCIPLHDYTGGV